MADFTVRYTSTDMEGNIKRPKPKSFFNKPSGFKAFLKRAEKIQHPGMELCFTMKATGVYYKMLAFYLSGQVKYVSVLMHHAAKKFNENLKKNLKPVGLMPALWKDQA